ncbi:CYFA0S06e01662g1_1 [Cyberlindnera fabianii]|uniref:CYFA0S06e01662g1_1 n=1 Tax=Cyberlindnera fabianii TaxID=36022 RepID=A0A061AV96_CYBFA|nr:Serine/threonine-protein kinase ssp1 [Cyberlindnera fabianii]CDR41100.1 CYFA0S06e01662g1_1 [Cyberlindnera fabianii]
MVQNMAADQAIPTVRDVNLTKDMATGEKFLNDYRLISKLGTGTNGKVYLAEDVPSGKQYAIKEITKVTKLSITNKDPKTQINKINNEIYIMKHIIQHPKVLRLYEVLDDVKFNKIFLVLEYCSEGELKFGATHNYTFSQLKMIMRDVVLGLEYIHGIGIIHRDIKPSNLLVNSEKFVKISDFGISIDKFKDRQHLSSFGTPAFLAPELCNISSSAKSGPNKIDGSCDIWALGITLYCLHYHKLPFHGNNEYELFNEIIFSEIAYPATEDKEEQLLVDLLKKMLQKEPKHRITLNEMKQHKFLNNDLTPDTKSQFLKFNERYLFERTENFQRSTSIHRKFKSIFSRRNSSSTPSSDMPVLTLPSTASLPVNKEPSYPISDVEAVPAHLLDASPVPPHLINSTPTLSRQTLLSPSPPQQHVRPPLRNPLASSSNSLNLNSLLRSKKDVPNYLDDSTYFQSLDSESSSSDSEDGSDEDGLYNDGGDTLSLRIGPKRANSSLAMKTMNEYLDL